MPFPAVISGSLTDVMMADIAVSVVLFFERAPDPGRLEAGLTGALGDVPAFAGRLRPADLFAVCTVSRRDEARLLADPALAAADPALDSLVNVNDPGEWAAARAHSTVAPVTIRRQ